MSLDVGVVDVGLDMVEIQKRRREKVILSLHCHAVVGGDWFWGANGNFPTTVVRTILLSVLFSALLSVLFDLIFL